MATNAELVTRVYEEIGKESIRPYNKLNFEGLPEGHDDLFISKLGGLPYIPRDAAPVPARFLCQIKCEEVVDCKVGIFTRFPKSGLLQFFRSDSFGGYVRYLPTIDTSVTPAEVKAKVDTLPMDDYEEDVIVGVSKITFEQKTASISHFDVDCHELYVKKYNASVEGALEPIEDHYDTKNEAECDENVQIRDNYESAHVTYDSKVGGFGNFYQDDTREAGSGWELLLMLQSKRIDDEHSMRWGDEGAGRFFIKIEDLESLNFDKVLFSWDCV